MADSCIWATLRLAALSSRRPAASRPWPSEAGPAASAAGSESPCPASLAGRTSTPPPGRAPMPVPSGARTPFSRVHQQALKPAALRNVTQALPTWPRNCSSCSLSRALLGAEPQAGLGTFSGRDPKGRSEGPQRPCQKPPRFLSPIKDSAAPWRREPRPLPGAQAGCPLFMSRTIVPW